MPQPEHKHVFKFKKASTIKQILGSERELVPLFKRNHAQVYVQGKKLVLKAASPQDLDLAIKLVSFLTAQALKGLSTKTEVASAYMRRETRRTTPVNLQPKNQSQADYLRCLADNDVVFGLGPAGTGKTFLAVAVALQHLADRRVEKLVLTRPIVEAGEKLGFLPGTFSEKVDPYLLPLFDSLNSLMGKGLIDRMKKDGRIEIAPLAYMRGRTFENSYVIVDEAQNCTFKQLTLVLTRLGEGSRCVLTGDISQSDLSLKHSGLSPIVDALSHVEGIGLHEFQAADVVRHPLVARIVEALEQRTRRAEITAAFAANA